ncbi:hypothetical protein M2267_001885 [Ensifer sp. KUDG1]
MQGSEEGNAGSAKPYVPWLMIGAKRHIRTILRL